MIFEKDTITCYTAPDATWHSSRDDRYRPVVVTGDCITERAVGQPANSCLSAGTKILLQRIFAVLVERGKPQATIPELP
jgi:hypothetical protein